MRKIKKAVLLLVVFILLFTSGCSNSFSQVDENVDCIVNSLLHSPHGLNNLYGSKEIAPLPYERIPREVKDAEVVKVRVATQPIDVRQEIWVEWQANGGRINTTQAKHISNVKIDGVPSAIWEASLGKYVKGDKVDYKIFAGAQHKAKKSTEIFSFNVCDWEKVKSVTNAVLSDGKIQLFVDTDGKLNPKVSIALEGNTLALSVQPVCDDNMPTTQTTGEKYLTLTNDQVKLQIDKTNLKIQAYSADGKLLFATDTQPFSFLTDGKQSVQQIRLDVRAFADETCQGFGIKYNGLNQKGKDVDVYCVNWYTDQVEETYSPVPYYFVPDRYGLYLDSTYYSHFDMGSNDANINSVYATVGESSKSDVYVFLGDNASVSNAYGELIGKPEMMPVWAFGPWISANEWNCQREVMGQIKQTLDNKVPTNVIVIEAWSDEDTFYTFNDSEFELTKGDEYLTLKDFTFKGRWPDPKAMIDYAHKNNIKIILWQIPVMRYSTQPTPQHSIDTEYAIRQGYLLKNKDGSIYRMPRSSWFGFSQLPDFTNPLASNWFMQKRKYLVTELGIDGFKTDGGEFVWGTDAISYDGRTAEELRNVYPDLYAQTYFDFCRKYKSDCITFSRAGGATLGSHPACWIGDQTSTFDSFASAVCALQSTSVSNIPFVTWDTAGFSGNHPTAELYKRSVAQSAFAPLMQVHSEQSGDPNPSMARTPWNMAQVKNDQSLLTVYRHYANVRMNLLPYIYSQAKYGTERSIPLVRSMAYQFGSQPQLHDYEKQYMFGDNLLVAPVISPMGRGYDVLLPQGEWYNLFNGKLYNGNERIVDVPSVDDINVFVKRGSIIPVNTDDSLQLGSDVGNDTNTYSLAGLRIYPSEKDSLQFYDYVGERTVQVECVKSMDKLTVDIDNSMIQSIAVRLDEVVDVRVNGKLLSRNQWSFDGKDGLFKVVSDEIITSAEFLSK